MAPLRFSHILLILALGTWILALIINLFFPAFLNSLSMAPAFFSLSATAVTFLLNLLPSAENNALAMLCFLLAMACSFVAGTVYGMELEAERDASINGGHWKEGSEDGGKNDRDLEKGVWEHAVYCEKDAHPYFTNHPFPYTSADAYTVRPLTSSTTTTTTTSFLPSEAPTGDAMTAEYYPTINSLNDTAAQATAHHTFLEMQFRQHLRYEGLEKQRLETQQYPDLPHSLYQPERVPFATRKLAQESERLQNELEKITQNKMEENREKVKEGLAWLTRNRPVRKEKEAKEQAAVADEKGHLFTQATAVTGDDLRAQLAAVLDTAIAWGPYSSFGSGVVQTQGSMSGFDETSGDVVQEDDVWSD